MKYCIWFDVSGLAEITVVANSREEAIEIGRNQICDAEYDLNSLVDVAAEVAEADDYDCFDDEED